MGKREAVKKPRCNYQELKQWQKEWAHSQPKPEDTEEKNVVENYSEAIQIYLKSGSYYTFVISDKDVMSNVLPLVAEKLKVSDIVSSLEICEEVMGKDRVLGVKEKLLEAKSKWPNQNPTYCKFKVKIQRGAPHAAQMTFREAMYG